MISREKYLAKIRPFYNQDLIKHSFLVEVGTTGNTLEEAYFGSRCLANILNKFYNN